ncbi:MAG: S-layer homology domain-containing protein [Clostridia bacterium]|nr:S-layer homology domain-containing protein [Clostridia bacterium]
MKCKKVIALFCICFLFAGIGISVWAAPYAYTDIPAHTLENGVNAKELVLNGSFDVAESDTKPQGWRINPGQFGPEGTAEYMKGEDSYIKMMFPGKTAALSQYIKVTDGDGKQCQLSAKVKGPANETMVRLRAGFNVLQDGAETEMPEVINVYFNDIKPNAWTQKVIAFTLPKDVTSINLSFRLLSDLEVYVNDISLLIESEGAEATAGKTEEKTEGTAKEEDFGEKPSLLQGNEMIVNGGFDAVSSDRLTVNDWKPEPGKGGTFDGRGATVENDGDAQGNYVKIVSGPTYPQVRQSVTNLLPTAEYRITFKYKNPGTEIVGFSCQMQYRKGGIPAELDGTKNFEAAFSKEWQEGEFDFVCPDGVDSCLVSFRNLASAGALCIDDVHLYMTKSPTRALVETDERFYYTEWETGYVTVEDRKQEGSLGNGKVLMSILDGEKPIIDTMEKTLSDGKTSFSFPILSTLSEKGKDYTVKVDIYEESGKYVETQSFPIARYDRPIYLGADGIFRKPDRNGVMREYNISIANNTPFTLLDNEGDEVKDIGITVIQMGTDPLKRPLMERLDAAEAAGRLVILSLYYGKESAGHPNKLQNTIDRVNEVKDHPALFGYKVQDEPIQKMNTDEELARAYKTIHDIDPNHPVYLDDSGEGSYKRLGRFCDIMDIDYYPGKGVNRASVIGKKIAAGVEAVKGRKPVMLLQQGFENNGTFPTADEFRHYWYQTLFAGGSGAGYHDFGGEKVHMSPERPEWAGLRKFAEWEQGFMLDCFVNRKYPMLHEGEGGDVRWRTYVKDNKIYAFIINQAAQSSAGAGANTATVPLTDTDGGKAATGYTAKRVAGGEEETLTIDGTTLTVELAPQAAYVYEITPGNTIDFSDLKITKYRDLLGYSWAYTSIVHMENAGVVNDITQTKFAPSEKITRGDFAYFLVNALGITGEGTASFADVPEDAYYAKAIAQGKAAGILNGIGNNLFNPESEISRQDLMTIAARGMRQYKGLEEGSGNELASYVDAGQIADYAVAEVAAMVKAGIIKGESDRILNPLGLTTRAEAAVIANRIYNR